MKNGVWIDNESGKEEFLKKDLDWGGQGYFGKGLMGSGLLVCC